MKLIYTQSSLIDFLPKYNENIKKQWQRGRKSIKEWAGTYPVKMNKPHGIKFVTTVLFSRFLRISISFQPMSQPYSERRKHSGLIFSQ
ncbi:hypothetical protein BLX87_03515 [Bacillus sp. VT-16-64]|nr:hypothetical protein BLX87_03515 [Bacillus sp. VT-16-64]